MRPSERQKKIKALQVQIADAQHELQLLVQQCAHVTDDWRSAWDDDDRVPPRRPLTCTICGSTKS